MQIDLPGDDQIELTRNLVMVGPNGAGKTRLGAQIAESNDGARISARKDLDVPADLQTLEESEARSRADRESRKTISNPTGQHQELRNILSEFIAEDTRIAREIKEAVQAGNGDSYSDPTSNKDRLLRIWKRHFPERDIDLTQYAAPVRSELSAEEGTYNLNQMSEGERTALYQIARVLKAESDLLVVDEPGLHLHPVLARRLWDDLEEVFAGDRIIYITHDIPFARSRREAQYGVVRPDQELELLGESVPIPEEVMGEVMGAISFSVTARQIVFCEGASTSLDYKLYEAWYEDPDTAVMPVGNCRQVRRSTSVVSDGDLIRGGSAIGIEDRDYRTEADLTSGPAAVHTLPLHEGESLFALPSVFEAVARTRGYEGQEAADLYEERVLEQAKQYFTGEPFNRQVLERVKRRLDYETSGPIHSVVAGDEIEAMREQVGSAYRGAVDRIDVEEVFQQERTRLEQAREGGPEAMLKWFPGKPILGFAANTFGVSTDEYAGEVIALVRRARSLEEEDNLLQVITESLEDYLPSAS